MSGTSRRWLVRGVVGVTLTVLGASVDETIAVDTILQGRIVHLQRRDRPDLEGDPRRQFMAVSIERTVLGKETTGTVVVRISFLHAAPGVRAWGRGGGPEIFVMDPGYWREGSLVSIGSGGYCREASTAGPEDPAERARARFGDEAFREQAASPLLCADLDHVFLLNEDGFIIDPDRSHEYGCDTPIVPIPADSIAVTVR